MVTLGVAGALLGGVMTASALLRRNLMSTLAKSVTKRTATRPREESETRSQELLVEKAGRLAYYLTAPKVNPWTSCFCVSQPSTMIGATASREAAESLAKKRPSGLE